MHIKNKKKGMLDIQQQLKPWATDESNLTNLILQSAEYKSTINTKNKNDRQKDIQHQQKLLTITQDYQSYNFYNNLRKYEQKKEMEYRLNKERNFIQKNKKEITEDDSYVNPHNLNMIMIKYMGEANRNKNLLRNNYTLVSQPVNWSVLMYMDQQEQNKRPKHRDIQGFLRFQSTKKQKKGKSFSNRKIQNQEEIKCQPDKYQNLLKVRENLRRRNLKSSETSRKKLYNSLNIQQGKDELIHSEKASRNFQKNAAKMTPKTFQDYKKPTPSERIISKTRQSSRKRKTIEQQSQLLHSLCSSTVSFDKDKKIPQNEMKVNATSHRNRHLLNVKGIKVTSS